MATPPTAERIYDYGQSSDYPETLYHYKDVAQAAVKSLSDVTEAHIAQFHEQGYLVIEQAFNPSQVQAALDGLLHLISGEKADFDGVMYEHKAQGIAIENLSPEEKQDYVRKFMWFIQHDERLDALAHHPKLLQVVERIIGDKPFLFQDMALLKPPKIGREKPWHQDHAYFNLPLEATVVGAWIALDEATIENGCMIVNPRSNRQGPVVHFQRRDWQICDTDVDNQQAVAVPLKPGGCLLFHSLTQHGTPSNHTGQRRRAVQYHYRGESAPQTDVEARLAIFGSEGKDVTC